MNLITILVYLNISTYNWIFVSILNWTWSYSRLLSFVAQFSNLWLTWLIVVGCKVLHFINVENQKPLSFKILTFSLAPLTPHHPNLFAPTHYSIPMTQMPIATTVVVSLTAKAPTLGTNPTLNLLQSNRVIGRWTTPLCRRRTIISLTIKERNLAKIC